MIDEIRLRAHAGRWTAPTSDHPACRPDGATTSGWLRPASERKPTVREVYAMAGGGVVTGRWGLRGSWRTVPVTATRTS
jgi:hypothetical protein